jgi:hypothetical protein
MQTQSNFHLIGHFVGNTKETNISLSFSFKMTLHTSELRKDLAQSNLVVLRSEEMKKILPSNRNCSARGVPQWSKELDP